jgi:hypothetical protein
MNALGVPWKRWLSACLGAVVGVLLLLGLFRTPVFEGLPSTTVASQSVPKVELAAHENELLVEEVALRDPTPLFLPTRWNAGEDALAMSAPREPGSSFQDYAPFFTNPATELNLEFPSNLKVPEKPADALAVDSASRSLFGLGHVDRAIEPVQTRIGFIEVVGASDGQVLMKQPLVGDSPPEQGSWQPMEFLVAVDDAGLVRPPVLSESSRVAEVDSFFTEYLLKVLHIGERLAPGFYRISIGP